MTLGLGAGLYKACQQISPRHNDYATLPIEDSFDWSSLSLCDFEQLYLVVFRSLRRQEADPTLLREQTTVPTRRHWPQAASSATSKATPTRGTSACPSASGKRASRPEKQQPPPRTAPPPASPHRPTSTTH